jgi:hypothetical protein
MAAMPFDEMLALLATLTSPNGEISLKVLGAGLAEHARPHGYAEIGRRMAKRLADQGAMERTGVGRYRITEKGRIAAALILHKHPDLRFSFIEAWDTPATGPHHEARVVDPS